jgi:hypothetical protein
LDHPTLFEGMPSSTPDIPYILASASVLVSESG